MSRDNIYEPPVINPGTLERWKKFREAAKAEWEEAWKPAKLFESTGRPSRNKDQSIPDASGRYTAHIPDKHRFDTKRFKSFGAPKETAAVEWGRDSKHMHRAEWQDGPFVCVATVQYDEHPQWDFVGDWTDKEPDTPASRAAWSWPKDPKAPHPNGGRLRAPDDMLYWMSGGVDTVKGGARDHGKYRYRKLADYDYYAERRMWWLLGYTKQEADLLARQDLASRLERFDDITENRIGMVGVVVKVYLAEDEDQEDELAAGGLWNIEDDSGEDYFASVALEVADRAMSDAKDTIRSRVARYQPHLPGISP